MDFDRIARELVRATRGRRAQAQLSRRLRYRGNQLYRWESGLRKISWEDYARLCAACDVHLSSVLRESFGFSSDPARYDLLVGRLAGDTSLAALSRLTGISKHSLGRWRRGDTEPSLADVLMLVHECQSILEEFVSALVPIESMPSLERAYRDKVRQKEVFYRFPVTTAIFCALSLDSYRKLKAHQPGFIARTLGIPLAEEERILQALAELGLVEKRAGHFIPLERDLDLRGRLFEHEQRVRAYWLARALRYVETARKRSNRSAVKINVLPVSRAAATQMQQELVAFYMKLQAIAASDSGPRDRVQVFVGHLLDLLELPHA